MAPSSHPQPRVQEAGRARSTPPAQTLNGLAREHDLSRNLIRIWVAKSESGEFDPDVEAATLLADYEAERSSRWSGWSAVRRSRSSSFKRGLCSKDGFREARLRP